MAEIYFFILIMDNIERVIAGYFNLLPFILSFFLNSSAKIKPKKAIFTLRNMIPKPSLKNIKLDLEKYWKRVRY